MPEVCEVCLTSQYLSKFIGYDILNLNVLSGRYVKHPMKGANDIQFPLKITKIDTKGKFMWFTLEHDNDTIYMLNTFGLTGKWTTDAECDFARVKFTTSTKYHSALYFCDMRNFGTIEFTDDVKILNKKLNKLGDDLLKSPPSFNQFVEKVIALRRNKKNIVTILMSQEKKTGIGSGLGNYLVPEILYRAKLSPYRTMISLTTSEIKSLYDAIKYQLKLCYIANNTEYIAHFEKFLKIHSKKIEKGDFPNYIDDIIIKNDTCHMNVYRKKTDPFGNTVIGDKIISNRKTYWVPSVQS